MFKSQNEIYTDEDTPVAQTTSGPDPPGKAFVQKVTHIIGQDLNNTSFLEPKRETDHNSTDSFFNSNATTIGTSPKAREIIQERIRVPDGSHQRHKSNDCTKTPGTDRKCLNALRVHPTELTFHLERNQKYQITSQEFNVEDLSDQ